MPPAPSETLAIHPSGMSAALHRWPAVRLRHTDLPPTPPSIRSVALTSWALETRGFLFPAPSEPAHVPCTSHPSPEPSQALRQDSQPLIPTAAQPPRSVTRIHPPSDAITLQDRLFYVLQPPIESWLSSAALGLPMQPFVYQYEGVAFLFPRRAALLADEMGLGKTMQAITAMRLLLHGGIVRSILLICPKPLVSNWQREWRLWAPEVPTLAIEGPTARRHWQWRLTKVPVKIANYELLPHDGALFLQGQPAFDLVVLDEAQRIKNRDSVTAQTARSIPRARSWALTGTPVENGWEDVASLLEFHNEIKPAAPADSAPANPAALKPLLRDCMLRRTKDQVSAQIPPRLYREACLELPPAQRTAYDLAEKEGIVRLNDLGDELTIQHVFELVLRLKQITNVDPLTGESCKLERLRADLEEVAASGQKALVFSQWVQTLDWLAEQLRCFRPLPYHGRIPRARREATLERFRNDPTVSLLLLSYGAGGVGLNLQSASYVFLFDRWWNPAVEDQAVNRAHRLGQQRPVTITRFLTSNTIEERIDEVLRRKRRLLDQVGELSDSTRLGLNAAEVFGLFHLAIPPASDRADRPIAPRPHATARL